VPAEGTDGPSPVNVCCMDLFGATSAALCLQRAAVSADDCMLASPLRHVQMSLPLEAPASQWLCQSRRVVCVLGTSAPVVGSHV
jgi:hypothetical protein